jgi:hypothetical protein
MEITTLQQRIEERAKQRLLQDLLQASEYLKMAASIIGKPLHDILNVGSYYSNYEHKTEIRLKNDAAQEIFNKLLPKYIGIITDEILQKIDEIDYLVQENRVEKEID